MHEQPFKDLDTVDTGEWREFESDGQKVFYLRVEVGDEKAGEVVATHTGRRWTLHIDGLFVEKVFRGRGLGEMLLSKVEELARRLGLKEIVLEPYPIDEGFLGYDGLIRWYLRNGFRHSGRCMCKPVE